MARPISLLFPEHLCSLPNLPTYRLCLMRIRALEFTTGQVSLSFLLAQDLDEGASCSLSHLSPSACLNPTPPPPIMLSARSPILIEGTVERLVPSISPFSEMAKIETADHPNSWSNDLSRRSLTLSTSARWYCSHSPRCWFTDHVLLRESLELPCSTIFFFGVEVNSVVFQD